MSRFFALQAISGQYHDIGVNDFFMNSRESMIPRGPWQNAVPPPDISTSDGDLLGLRCISQYLILHIHLHLLIIYNPIPWGPIYALFTPGRWCQVLGLVKLSPLNLQQLKGKPFKPSAWPRGSFVILQGVYLLFHPTSNISLPSLLPPSSSQGSSFLQSSHRGAPS